MCSSPQLYTHETDLIWNTSTQFHIILLLSSVSIYLWWLERVEGIVVTTVVWAAFAVEQFLYQRVDGLVDEGVHPEGEAGGETVHEGEPGQGAVLVHDHVAKFEDDVVLQMGQLSYRINIFICE